MDYQQAYDFLLSLYNIPRLEYLKDKKKSEIYLKRLQFLLDILGNPEKKIPHYIHLTGTSGKGSVAIMLASILRAAGKKTGLLTSPHPSAITERWEINGRTMNKKIFAQTVEKIKSALEKYINTAPYDLPSFFEIVTAMGLMYFAQNKVRWAVIEVGLGGRNDSTNVIPRKDLAIITNIGLDHVNLIGPTKTDIAREKVGIIKPGCRVLTAEKNPKILKIIKDESAKQKTFLKILKPARQSIPYHLTALGQHQINNARLAIEAATMLGLNQQHIQKGISTVRLPLRMEIISRRPLIILDGAHNPDKMKTTIQTAKELRATYKKIHLVIGFSADKNIKNMLKQLVSLHPTTVACTRSTSNPFRQVADPRLLQKQARALLPRTKSKIFLDPLEAYRWSKKQTKTHDLLLVTGSIFLSGELRPYLTGRQ